MPAMRLSPPPLQPLTPARNTTKPFIGNSGKLHIHTSSSLPRFMSGYHHYPHGYSTDEHDASAEDLFQDPGQQFPSHFAPYPEQLWPAPIADDHYHIQIDTSAVLGHGPNPGILNPGYTPVQSSYATTSQHQQQHWGPEHQPRRGSSGSIAGSIDSVFLPGDYAAEPFAYGPYPVYPRGPHISPVGSAHDILLSPTGYGSQNVSPHTTPPHLTPPTTPGGSPNSFAPSPSPDLHSPLLPFVNVQPKVEERAQSLYTHRDQLQFFKDALSLPAHGVSGPFVPQLMYKPHTNSDRRRYVEEVDMEAPIHFWVENPSECGIPLSDALHSRVRRLLKRDETVFEGRGPSVSIRLEWPGYRQWSRQIPTKDFRSPPGPITRAKLAKNVAKCVQRFIQERHGQPMEDDADARWRVGPGPNQIKLEDLILVSIHHVSMGSWQPHLRLRRPL
ncbi:hypothetical protein C8F04DRAFT_1258846 [Mycena alexandri]|uniref:Uncharacterized protein n=1 Tax=Mycena alexandri TaxID=1745969 RepID=A0AAD6SX30_9AGAR|nr:hypothetical protein C8F04DRAFT_1258846 [Mycena alexandri]